MSNEEERQKRVEALIQENLRLVLRIANDFIGRGLPWDDLVSEGNKGLMTAAERYDSTQGAKFSTYSACWIKQAIYQALAEQVNLVRIPVGTLNKSRKIKRAVKEFAQRNTRKTWGRQKEIPIDPPLGHFRMHLSALYVIGGLRGQQQSIGELLQDDSLGVAPGYHRSPNCLYHQPSV